MTFFRRYTLRTLSLSLLAETVISARKAAGITQAELAKSTGISRPILSNLENGLYTPSIHQLEALAARLNFDPADLFVEQAGDKISVTRSFRIAVAGVGYVGLSLAVLLAQNHSVTAVCTKPEKAEMINRFCSPIQDEYIEKYLLEASEGKRKLNLSATVDGASAYADADFIILAVPTNYDPKTNYFDCSAVENVLKLIRECTAERQENDIMPPADEPGT